MFDKWQRNIAENLKIVEDSLGPELSVIVSRNNSDRLFWEEVYQNSKRDTFRRDGKTKIISAMEEIPKGNFLGTLKAWAQAKTLFAREERLPDIGFMAMLLGEGRRLSPFAQFLGNRKPAFLLPMKFQERQSYATVSELASIYSNLWVNHLRDRGFRGIIIKWGDEAIIPGEDWSCDQRDLSGMDAIRFVWKTKMTETLAREKDWVLSDSQTGLMKYQYARQDIDTFLRRLEEYDSGIHDIGVNLGSLAVSYDFLNDALDVFMNDVYVQEKRVDWDPYVWIALFCDTEARWVQEIEYEKQLGKRGILELISKYPDFYSKIRILRERIEHRKGRPLSVALLDFGEAFWVDIGLHSTLRECLESLTKETTRGITYRDIFRITHEKDINGNRVINSSVAPQVDIRDSVIIDSSITDPMSVIHGGLVVGGIHKTINMPHGGSALFCDVERLSFLGKHGIAYGSRGPDITVAEGGRHTTLLVSGSRIDLISNESILNYSDENYLKPICENMLSFREAGEIMLGLDSHDIIRLRNKKRTTRLLDPTPPAC